MYLQTKGDNLHQLSSEFVKYYRSQVLHSSLRYPQSNGFIESMVRVAKHIISKADQVTKDAYLTMFAYRGTPK